MTSVASDLDVFSPETQCWRPVPVVVGALVGQRTSLVVLRVVLDDVLLLEGPILGASVGAEEQHKTIML